MSALAINPRSRSGYEVLRFWASQVHGLLVSLHLRALAREGLTEAPSYEPPSLEAVTEMRAALASLEYWDRRDAIATVRYLFHKERAERGTAPTSREYVARVRAYEAAKEGGER